MNFLDILSASFFLLLLLLIGLRKSHSVKSETTYLLAGRKTPLFALTATLVMTEFNTATLLSFSSMGYLFGMKALSLPLVFLIGLLFYGFSVARKWKQYNGLSVASYFSERYGRDIGILASIALVTSMLGFSAAYVKSLYLLFTPVFPQIGPWALSGMLVIVVLLMTLRGGLISIIRTDVAAGIATFCFFPLFLFFAAKGSSVDIPAVEGGLSVRFIVSLIVLTSFTYILAPWYGQKIFSAKDEKTAFLSVIFAAVLVFLLYGMALMGTWYFRKNGGVAPSAEQALPFAISHVLPSGLRGLGYALLFAASATTLTGVWSAMCTLVIGDFLGEKSSPRRSMIMTVCFAFIALILANVLVDKVFDKLILANIPIAALSFALLGGFYWKRASRLGAYLSIIVGWAVGIGCYLFFEEKEYTWYWASIGVPLIFIVGIAGSFKETLNNSFTRSSVKIPK